MTYIILSILVYLVACFEIWYMTRNDTKFGGMKLYHTPFILAIFIIAAIASAIEFLYKITVKLMIKIKWKILRLVGKDQ